MRETNTAFLDAPVSPNMWLSYANRWLDVPKESKYDFGANLAPPRAAFVGVAAITVTSPSTRKG